MIKPKEEKERFSYVKNIRALAIAVVVLGHSIILYSSSWGLYETVNKVEILDYLKNVINIFQMPLFFSLSGFLFVFTHRKKRGFLRLFSDKVKRLLIPYIGIGLLYLVPLRLAVGYKGYQNLQFKDLPLLFLKCEDVGHLWFLPALLMIFLLSELLLILAEKICGIKKCPEILMYVVALTIYFYGKRICNGYTALNNVYNYMIWFSFGYFLSKNISFFERINQCLQDRIIKIVLIVLSFIFSGCYFLVSSGNPIVSLIITAVFITVIYGVVPQKTNALVEKIDRNSFGIYLFHSPLIYITFANIPNANPALIVFINFIFFGMIAFYMTETIRRTKLKILLGE